MLLAVCATVIVVAALLGEMTWPRIVEAVARHRARRRVIAVGHDPGRERRAEQRARTLLRSCVNDEEWAMYRDLGFIRVWGSPGPASPSEGWGTTGSPASGGAQGRGAAAELGLGHEAAGGAPYAYLIYPHRPIVAFVPQTGRLLNEYCVEFPDHTRPYGSALLPESDDVLAKWMGLTGDERRIIGEANMHLPGRQVDPRAVRRDLWRLREWEHERARGEHGRRRRGGTVPAP